MKIAGRCNNNTFIRSSKLTLKFVNKGKQETILNFLNEYRRVVSLFVDIFWEMEKIPHFIEKEYRQNINSWLNQRVIQAAGQQASGIVRGTRARYQKALYIRNKLLEKRQKIKYLETIKEPSKPKIDYLAAQLDSRFFKVENGKNSFDLWLRLWGLQYRKGIIVPLKKHKHFNKLQKRGKLLGAIWLSEKYIIFSFEFNCQQQEGDIKGMDIGLTNTFTLSNGQTSQPDIHGHTLVSILRKMSKKQKGSNGFKRVYDHRRNYINWSLNQLNLNGTRQLNIEKFKKLRYRRRVSRFLSHWSYATIFDKLSRKCEEEGVLINRIFSAYSSLRCSRCGELGERHKKLFLCKCGVKIDADYNASLNIRTGAYSP